jgi:hypothetical protein
MAATTIPFMPASQTIIFWFIEEMDRKVMPNSLCARKSHQRDELPDISGFSGQPIPMICDPHSPCLDQAVSAGPGEARRDQFNPHMWLHEGEGASIEVNTGHVMSRFSQSRQYIWVMLLWHFVANADM